MNKRHVMSVLLVCASLWSGSVRAQEDVGDEVICSVARAAASGNILAQFELGRRYYHGLRVEKNYARAAAWFRAAAEQGHAEAQLALALLYHLGEGVDRNPYAATRWFRAAAEQGVTQAQYFLGKRCMDGQGTTRDYVQAHFWLNLADSGGYVNGSGERPARCLCDKLVQRMTPEQCHEAKCLAESWAASRH